MRPAKESMRAAGIRASWKVVTDNFIGCYHYPNPRPEFADMVQLSVYQAEAFGIESRHFGSMFSFQIAAHTVDSNAPVKCDAFLYL